MYMLNMVFIFWFVNAIYFCLFFIMNRLIHNLFDQKK